MEPEVGQGPAVQVVRPAEGKLADGNLQHDVATFGAFVLRRLDAANELQGFGDAFLQVIEAGLVVLVRRR